MVAPAPGVQPEYADSLRQLAQPPSTCRGPNTPLMDACEAGNLVRVRELLAADPPPDPSRLSAVGSTALIFAAKGGNARVVDELLKRGYAPNVINSSGWTPLEVAQLTSKPDVERILIAAGAVEVTRRRSVRPSARMV